MGERAYEVVREHSGPLSTLLSASDTAMECLKVVDIRVEFGKLNPVILQDEDRFQCGQFLASLDEWLGHVPDSRI